MSCGTSNKDDWWAGAHDMQGHIKRAQFVQSKEKKAKDDLACCLQLLNGCWQTMWIQTLL